MLIVKLCCAVFTLKGFSSSHAALTVRKMAGLKRWGGDRARIVDPN